MLTKLRSLARDIAPVQFAGNVSIDRSAAIAPGVLLLAEGNNRIEIAAGVCIGAGSIVRANGGNVTIGAGVCIGRAVLIIGSGSIARDACIGAGTTAIDPQIEEGAVVPPHSLLGDRSRGEVKVVEDREVPENLNGATPSAADPDTEDVWGHSTVGSSAYPHYYKVKTPVERPAAPPIQPPSPAEVPPTPPPIPDRSQVTVTTTSIEHTSTSYVSGRAQFDRIKRALFPNSGNNDDTA
jgi:carbon dioxide concentrating mechanism protein CcmN